MWWESLVAEPRTVPDLLRLVKQAVRMRRLLTNDVIKTFVPRRLHYGDGMFSSCPYPCTVWS